MINPKDIKETPKTNPIPNQPNQPNQPMPTTQPVAPKSNAPDPAAVKPVQATVPDDRAV